MSVEKVLSEVEGSRRELAEVCSQLIQRPSQHPEGRTDECVAYIKDYFDQLGIPTRIYKRKEEKPNIVAQIAGTTGRCIMWIGHLDVVPEGKLENWTYPPYSGKITADGMVWGRGSSDCKGACAAAMIAARILNELEGVPNSVDFWFTADEEIGGVDGAYWLAEERILKGDVCIVGDSCPGSPVAPIIDLGCKGGGATKLIACGKTAHGSAPFLGDNAIDKLIRVIPYIKKIADFHLELPEELEPVIKGTVEYILQSEGLTLEQREAVKKLFHHPSVSLTTINGGVKINVIPDYAEAYFDIRLTPGSDPMKVRKRVLELVKEAGEPGVTAEVRVVAGYYESPNTPFAQQLAETVERVTGDKPIFNITTGGTDAIRIKRFIRIPCLGFGATMGGQAHAPDEHNSIELIAMGSKVYATFPLIYRD